VRRIFDGLRRTRERLLRPLQAIVSRGGLDDEAVEEIEALLYGADLGVEATEQVIEGLRGRSFADTGEALRFIGERLREVIDAVPAPARPPGDPRVIVVIGVNGVGKTSTIGKLAARVRAEGGGVLLAACDTFRAAAIEQLELWAKRAGVPVVRQQMGSDPAAVAFDAVQAARARGIRTVIVDTAGRLHTKSNLMEELHKVFRVLERRIEGVAVEAWLVLDANAGQNSIRQAEVFTEALPVTGIVLTKLDSTAKGGVVIPIQQRLGVPVLYVGVGESLDDLEPFDPAAFVEGLLGK
jgi:fused signal recognition particle receptor